jgi:two-component system sensor histidine kinase CssS
LGSHLVWHVDIEPVIIKGNDEKLTVAIENILDNAIRYAKSDISISVKKNKKTVRVEISNDGEHIKPENLDKIFQGLYKDKTGNFGLGLAITQKIVSFYGGDIFAENKEKGVSVIIDFPV